MQPAPISKFPHSALLILVSLMAQLEMGWAAESKPPVSDPERIEVSKASDAAPGPSDPLRRGVTITYTDYTVSGAQVAKDIKVGKGTYAVGMTLKLGRTTPKDMSFLEGADQTRLIQDVQRPATIQIYGHHQREAKTLVKFTTRQNAQTAPQGPPGFYWVPDSALLALSQLKGAKMGYEEIKEVSGPPAPTKPAGAPVKSEPPRAASLTLEERNLELRAEFDRIYGGPNDPRQSKDLEGRAPTANDPKTPPKGKESNQAK